ncbi:hypothetical protein GCM10029964_072500 [Kibdelosporangium lantanae]
MTKAAQNVGYYQFADVGAMDSAFTTKGDYGPACGPDAFDGEHPNPRAPGRIRCGTDPVTGAQFLQWTDEARGIAVFAHFGFSSADMLEWWARDAGPV